ncbi:MAG: hypothetical protein AAF573_02920, partial [Bacteroidota bacterium]
MFGILKKKKKEGCPCCDNSDIVAFLVGNFKEEYIYTIVFEEKIGEYMLHRCTKCDSLFYKEKEHYNKTYYYHLISEDQKATLKQWVDYVPTKNKKFKNQIKIIKYSETWNSNFVIPCMIKLKNGLAYDF